MPCLYGCGHCSVNLRYKSARSDDEDLRKRLRDLALERRRLHILLWREGMEVDRKKMERFTVRKRGGRKCAFGTRVPMTIPQEANQGRSLDFVYDSLVDGHRFCILCVIDDFSRKCKATIGDNSPSGSLGNVSAFSS